MLQKTNGVGTKMVGKGLQETSWGLAKRWWLLGRDFSAYLRGALHKLLLKMQRVIRSHKSQHEGHRCSVKDTLLSHH